MTGRMKVVDVDLGAPARFLGDMDGYGGLRAVVRLHGTPVGDVDVPLPPDGLTSKDLRRIIVRRLARPLILHHLRDAVERPLPPAGLSFEELLNTPHPAPNGNQPLVTVAVCTRDRTSDLRLCLDSLLGLDYPRLDLLVVDNAPLNDATARLVRESYPEVRYVREPIPGLDWARNRAILEARGDILAYTDDDVIVDAGWVTALSAAFEDPQVMAVTGLIVPHELETEPQIIFERYGGFGRGFRREHWRIDREGGESPFWYLGAGKYGTGANMAYRRSLFEYIGPFDPALDVGTVTNGGGDLEMFFRVLKEGYLLVYEPKALVRHRHRRDYPRLRAQLANNGIAVYAYLVRTALAYPEIRNDILRFGLWWFWWRSVRRIAASFIPLRRLIASPTRMSRFPRDLIWVELWGSLLGLGRYQKARRRAARLSPSGPAPGLPATPPPAQQTVRETGEAVGVRMIDLCQPPRGLDDVASYGRVRVFVSLGDRPMGAMTLDNRHRPVGAAELRDAVVDRLGLDLLGQEREQRPRPGLGSGPRTLPVNAEAALRRRYLPDSGSPESPAKLPDEVPVSVVVATYDRPGDLRGCLRRLTVQESTRPVEIVVVDNNPTSGLTPPVVAEFPGTRLVTEPRQGLAYARNKGFAASTGAICIATDDDVSVPPNWLERLVAPFVRADVMTVTGNVLPLELETPAQRSFERYGGLGRGFIPREVDSEWFNSFRRFAVPTWSLGATANAAFRASIFSHPEIGLMDEALGPGTPTGVGEDTYLFYRVLKAGYTIAYEPSAYVWHRHRSDMPALRNQIYAYSKGHVAYHLTTLLRDRDVRALRDLTVRLPRWHLRQLTSYAKRRLSRKDHYPLGLILLEIRGNLAGFQALWQSYRRVRREGRSTLYVPRSQ